jgi:hypothetical protein
VGSWTTKTTLGVTRHGFALEVYNGYVYVYGGTNNSTDLNTIEYAQITANGGLSSWTSATMNTGGGSVSIRTAVSGAVYNGYLYILGGTHSGTPNAEVYYAPLNTSNGSVGTWVSTTGFTTARSSQASFAYAGYIYVMGGQDGSSNFLQDVQVAPLNSNGTITAATWVTAASLLVPRSAMRVVAANGFVYVVAGETTSGTDLTTTDYAPIGAAGKLGAWAQTNGGAFATARTIPGATIYNGILYMPGGAAAGTAQTSLQYTVLNQVAHIGRYSKLIDLGAAVNVTSITNANVAGVSLPSAAVTYRAAASSTFGSSAQTATVSGSNGCLGNVTGTRYLWVQIALDDSYGLDDGGIFPDVLGVTNGTSVANSNLDLFTVNYSTVHPAPSVRLRGGKTLQSGASSALDTCS